MDVVIQNSTEDDATVKVSPGGPPSKDPKRPGGKEVKVLVKSKTTKKLSSLPDSCVVHFIVPVEVGNCKVESDTIQQLTLTKVVNDGYKIVTGTKA